MSGGDRFRMAADLLAAGASTVYEASGRHGGLTPAIRPIASGMRVCGPAFTAACHPGDNLAVHRALAAAPSGSVLVVAGDGVLVGYWGELMTIAAQARGIAGLVIEGGIRDVAALAARGFPVWACGVSMRGATKETPGEIGIQIVCGGVMVAVGDWIVGDDDGVVRVPADELDHVAEAAIQRAKREAGLAQRLGAGELTLDVLDLRGVLERKGGG